MRSPSHAGGVVYRRRDGTLEFLLVRSKDRSCRVLPKGHVEPGEEVPDAAAREVHEESGYQLMPGPQLGVFIYPARAGRIATAYYLMHAESVRPGHLEEPFRDPRWFTIDDIGRADLRVPAGVRKVLERARRLIESAP